jgi:hypothetical protein
MNDEDYSFSLSQVREAYHDNFGEEGWSAFRDVLILRYNIDERRRTESLRTGEAKQKEIEERKEWQDE